VAVLGLLALAGCGSSLLGTTSSGGGATTTTPSTSPSATPSTTVPVDGEVAVAFPVVACTDPGAGGRAVRPQGGWSPTILLAPVPTSLVGKVTFYSDGVHVVLGPTGWTCSPVTAGPGGTTPVPQPGAGSPASSGTTVATAPSAAPTAGQGAAMAAPGATNLAVYPPNDPLPPTSGPPTPGAEGIFATFATTGSKAGVDLVCPYFTLPSWQTQQAGCSTAKPFGETTDVLTPDVTQMTDPSGLVGGVAASGGQSAVTGVVLFPQVPSAVSSGSPIAVAAESCSLADAALCPTVLSDFEVREFPVPAGG